MKLIDSSAWISMVVHKEWYSQTHKLNKSPLYVLGVIINSQNQNANKEQIWHELFQKYVNINVTAFTHRQTEEYRY
jgi:hypothetical protein